MKQKEKKINQLKFFSLSQLGKTIFSIVNHFKMRISSAEIFNNKSLVKYFSYDKNKICSRINLEEEKKIRFFSKEKLKNQFKMNEKSVETIEGN